MTKSALILIDIQNDYFPGGKYELHGIEASAANARRLLDHARSLGDLIVHVRHENESSDAPFFAAGTPGAEFHATLQPATDEPVVLKHRINAFLGTGLKQLLDENGITEITIAGDMSHMCIDAATRAAADYGYTVTVAEDACSARDLEFNGDVIPAVQVHKAFMAALAFGYAAVVGTDACLLS
ncbi:cysteine hydrolase family protein [Leisingera thetidis]|uniref:cysteine hydrolase family protein n=1 Tax=Leisingera thetidis TaxID=2930199 RepID=UPI0021F72659|nr:cysteine hydrolase family protein [Leisingera thetidis]